jgi:transposase
LCGKNEVHSILHAPACRSLHARNRAWLAAPPLPDDEGEAIEWHVHELDRLAEDLALLDREIVQDAFRAA